MNNFRTLSPAGLLALILIVAGVSAHAAKPVTDARLEPLAIDKHGALQLDGDKVTYSPWRSDAATDKVHVIQYLAATKSASEIYKPLTDALQTTFEPGTLLVTSIINLNAALWGTSGFVMSEVKKNKRKHPESIMVLDKAGQGAQQWELGKKGSALLIVDKTGVVKFFTTTDMDDTQLASTLALLKDISSELQ